MTEQQRLQTPHERYYTDVLALGLETAAAADS